MVWAGFCMPGQPGQPVTDTNIISSFIYSIVTAFTEGGLTEVPPGDPSTMAENTYFNNPQEMALFIKKRDILIQASLVSNAINSLYSGVGLPNNIVIPCQYNGIMGGLMMMYPYQVSDFSSFEIGNPIGDTTSAFVMFGSESSFSTINIPECANPNNFSSSLVSTN
jgi:hypothetical protein